jgi:hypothetical protein
VEPATSAMVPRRFSSGGVQILREESSERVLCMGHSTPWPRFGSRGALTYATPRIQALAAYANAPKLIKIVDPSSISIVDVVPCDSGVDGHMYLVGLADEQLAMANDPRVQVVDAAAPTPG